MTIRLPSRPLTGSPRPASIVTPSSAIKVRILGALGSLRLAIVLLSLFTVCLAGATWLEARYSARIAQELVYRAWWFALLLAVLAGNVVGAALKKIPWKKHQTGFLITHLGLLLLLAGGLLTVLFGEEGQVVLIDTAHPALRAHLGIRQQTDRMSLTGVQRLEVYRCKRVHMVPDDVLAALQQLDRGEELGTEQKDCVDGPWVQRFEPGPFAWHSDEHFNLRLPWELSVLHELASPWPGCRCDLDGQVILTVENYYPHADPAGKGTGRFIPHEVAPGSDTPERPALRCRLSTAAQSQEFWIGLDRGATPVRLASDLYLVRYRSESRPLGFTLTLRRARQIKDPGSDRPAWYESEVTVAARENDAAQEQRIYMNHPLDQGPYKVYQANYRALTNPSSDDPILVEGKPVSISGFAVARDPGLPLKYAGSLVVVLGIATMFYMRAYFFRPAIPSSSAVHAWTGTLTRSVSEDDSRRLADASG